MKILRNFAVFEGCDGSGTTTQMGLLRKRLQARSSPPFFLTSEPTDGPIGRLIRSALGGDAGLAPETVARLFAADRGEHLFASGGIAERAGRGELVVSDRYVPSSLVYQGLACGGDLPRILNEDFPAPELIVFFDLESETALERMKNREKREIYEYPEFQARVGESYRRILPSFRDRGTLLFTVNASGSPEEVAGEVWRALSHMPILKA
ncbi:MAG: dTMP kinase [Treponema sp.]|jgi:dTMP kinase|nr:dTMP kinase [Treponema sp.]